MIQSHGNLFIKSSVLTNNIKKSSAHWQHQAQFPLAISKSPVSTGNIKKPSSHWQYQKAQFPAGNIKSPIYVGTILSKAQNY